MLLLYSIKYITVSHYLYVYDSKNRSNLPFDFSDTSNYEMNLSHLPTFIFNNRWRKQYTENLKDEQHGPPPKNGGEATFPRKVNRCSFV